MAVILYHEIRGSQSDEITLALLTNVGYIDCVQIMSNKGQIGSIDLRQPIGAFSKVLMVVLSVGLLAFLAGALLGECEEPVWKWLIVAMAVVPAIGSAGATLFVLWGRKYLLLKDDMVEIHWEVLGFQRVKRIQLGRRSRLILYKTSCETFDDDGGTESSEMLELQLTDALGYAHRLLQFDARQREQVEQIAAEIVQQLPQLELVQK
jgi:hypothetical protein